ncbi:MAG: sulfatase-like hydrolase/transferase [Chloroflexota bacterium]
MTKGRANLLFVFPDQMQAGAMGVAGHSTVQTPTLDRLARQGLRCTKAIANCPLCTPSRATMLSGRYPLGHGAVTNWLPLPTEAPTFGQVLRDAGWRTGYIGKWHLNGAQRQAGFVPPGPQRHGFDYWAAFNDGHHYFDGVYFRDDPKPIPIHGYEPDGQTDLAIDFIEQSAEPWALFVSWGPPHQPYNDVLDAYKALYDPASVYVRSNTEGGNRQIVADYYAAITALDANLGRLLAAVEREGQTRRTLVVFTTDHGDMLFSHGLREKHQPYEESIRVPLLVRFPGILAEGKVYDGLVTIADPFQQRNLVAEPSAPSVLNACRGELQQWLVRTDDAFLPWRDLLRGKSLQELWNTRERVVHEEQEELL